MFMTNLPLMDFVNLKQFSMKGVNDICMLRKEYNPVTGVDRVWLDINSYGFHSSTPITAKDRDGIISEIMEHLDDFLSSVRDHLVTQITDNL